MEPLQIIIIIALFVVIALGTFLFRKKIKESSMSVADQQKEIMDRYIEDVIRFAKDVIVITGIKKEFCDTEEDYKQILMRHVARRLVDLIYRDLEVDERLKEIINEETILPVLILIYDQYEKQILEKVEEEEEFITLPRPTEVVTEA